MFKKFLNLIKSNKEQKVEKEEMDTNENLVMEEQEDNSDIITSEYVNNENVLSEICGEGKNDSKNESILEIINIINDDHELHEINKLDVDTTIKDSEKTINIKDLNETEEMTKEDLIYIKKMKIHRGKSIKAIDVYSKKEIIFETHKQCSKTLGIPVAYIQENLEYGYTDYFGEAINYISKKLRVDISNLKEDDKNIVEIFNYLHDQIWSGNVSEKKREEILSSEKIDSIKMHYKFEILDNEYDEYFKKYGKLIRRGGKKKIELIDKKDEVIEVFRSLDDCAKYFNKDKNEIIYRLKYGECKIGRYEIRYSLTR